jgi:peptidoglycan L-alanyl-D-glutamate endopeptidase CwlK
MVRNSVSILLTCTFRSDEEQAKLYAQGRTAPGRIVTNAKPGKSKHNAKTPQGKPASRAYDVVPLRHGKPVWGTEGEDGEIWQMIGAHGKDVGLAWAGDWTTFKEFPHFELPS